MKNKLQCILLVDDDTNCNYYHKMIMEEMEITENIEVATDGKMAIDFLTTPIDNKHPRPDIIFLDINMPVMDGWEFLTEYEKLEDEQKGKIVLVMLTTSLNPDDKEKANRINHIKDFKNKYLDKKDIEEILVKYFPSKS